MAFVKASKVFDETEKELLAKIITQEEADMVQ
jgi:hypothetical protein